jgi:hypothetical protein
MLEFLLAGGKLSERQLRLFACGCCRGVWHLLADPRSRGAVDLAERYADGGAGKAELTEARQAASEVEELVMSLHWKLAYGSPERIRSDRLVGAVLLAADVTRSWLGSTPRRACEVSDEPTRLAAFLRDIGGNPFRDAPDLPASVLRWHDATVVNLAQSAYDHRLLPSGHLDPARLAVLADALEDAGCQDAEILGHLRGPGPHVRGCYVVDLLLARE